MFVSTVLPYSLLFLAMSSTDGAVSTPSTATALDEVIVVGTRTKGTLRTNPHSVTIVSRKKIDRTPVSSVAELLQGSPGMEVTDANSAGTRRIRVRGEDSRRITVLIDGQELTDHSTYGTPILENNSNIERIEVVHGPASVLYGAKAIGGVVNIVTRGGEGDKPINGELGFNYFGGSDGVLLNAALFGTIGDFAYRLAGYKEIHHDIRVRPSEWSSGLNRLRHTKTHGNGMNLALGYRLGDQRNHQLHLKLEDSKLSAENWREPGILTSSFMPLDLFDINLPQRDKRKVGFYYDGEDLGGILHKVHADAYYQRVDRAFANRLVSPLFHTDAFIMKAVAGNIPPFIENQIPTISQALYPILEPFRFNMNNLSNDRLVNYGGTVQLDFALPYHHYFITGVNYLSDHLQTDKVTDMLMTGLPIPKFLIDLHWAPSQVYHHVAGNYKAHIDTVSLFVQDEWQVVPDLKLTAGLRHYRINTHLDRSGKEYYLGQKENHTLKSASLVYTGLSDTALRIGYSEGYISPNIMQLFIPTDAGGIASLPNPNLKSETAKNWEAGIRYNVGTFSMDGTLFITKAENYISLRSCRHNGHPLCASGGKFRPSAIYENIDYARTQGIELTSAYQFSNGIEPYVSLTYMRRKESLNGRDTYDTDVPKYSGRLGVRYQQQEGKAPFWVDGFMRTSSRVTLAPELNPSYPGGDIPMKPLKGWATLNVAAGVSSKLAGNTKLDITAQVNNLTNKAYRSSFGALPGEARNLSLSARLRF